MARVSLVLIRAWQLTLGPVFGVIGGCRYHPSCSHYGYEAIHKYGFFKGWKLTLWRIARCNPFTAGGHDPVP